MMPNYKIGVCEFSFPCWGPLAIQMAAKAGYEGMQLADAGGAANAYPLLNDFIRNAYLETAEQSKLTFQAIHFHSLFHRHLIDHPPESALGTEAREHIAKDVEACCLMRIPVAMITVTNILSAEQYANVCDALRYANELCKDAGIRLTIETDLRPDAFHRLQEDIGQGAKLCFDTMNPMVYGIGVPSALIHQYGIDQIDHFHVKDCAPNSRGFFTKYTTPMRLIGEGESGFSASANVIRESGFQGWIISESFYFDSSFEGADYLALAKKDVLCLRKNFH